MTKYHIFPSHINGDVTVPSSKSHTIRAILFGMLGKGKTIIRNPLESPDATAMMEAARHFGARIHAHQNRLEIAGLAGELHLSEDVIQAGNSGQVLRFVGAIAGLSKGYTVITGDHSIRHNRPVKPLLHALQQLGAFAVSSRLDGCAPIIIRGPLKSGTATLEGLDSQPVSGILIATAFAEGTSQIQVNNPGEKPWIDLTLSWFDRLGIKYTNKNYEHFTMKGHSAYDGFDYTVPGDFSQAAYPIVAALITDSEVRLHNIDMHDVQGDKKLIDALIDMGAKIEIDHQKKTLTVKKGSVLKGRKIDVNDFIDAITILAVVGCFAEGKTEIVNGAVARTKESDRIHAITSELKKMGAHIEERKDGMVITPASLHGAHVSSHRDHRLVMSLSVAAFGARSGETVIDGAEYVVKTYPDFAHHFQTLGARIEVIP